MSVNDWRADEVRDLHRRGLITAGERGEYLDKLEKARGASAKDGVLSALRRLCFP